MSLCMPLEQICLCLSPNEETGKCYTPSEPEFYNWNLRLLCSINDNTAGGGGGGSGVSVVQSCLEVTVAGAWGALGNTINVLQFFDTTVDPPTLSATLYYNVNTQALVTGITGANTEPCVDATRGDSCANPTYTVPCATSPAGTQILTSLTATAAGSVAAGKVGVTIHNTGTTAAVVDGQSLPGGGALSFGLITIHEGVVITQYRTAAISYDATGTSLVIRTITV